MELLHDWSRKRIAAVTLGVCFVSSASPASGQCQIWNQIAYTARGARAGVAMASDSRDLPIAGIILFGGLDGSSFRGDTWRLNGSAWTLVATTGPSARWFPNMVFDSARGKIVLYGGSTALGPTLGDTWEWDGASWTQRASIGPPIRIYGAMAYDEIRQRTVLFGGTPTSGLLNDTWEWDGNTWTQVFPTSSPPARTNHSMAYDADCRMIVIHGGFDFNGSLTDTWLFDGSEWHPLVPSVPPAWGGADVRMVYDTLRHRAVLCSGSGALTITPFPSTWELLGGDWVNTAISVTNGPVFTGGAAVCYDPARGKTLLYGGGLGFGLYWANPLNQLWEYSTPGSPVAITQQPCCSTVILSGQSTLFTIAASGSGPLSYQRRANGFDLTNGGAWSGVTTPTITITGFGYADGAYDCVVTNRCGSARTDPVFLDVRCYGDANFSGVVDFADVTAALANFGFACP